MIQISPVIPLETYSDSSLMIKILLLPKAFPADEGLFFKLMPSFEVTNAEVSVEP